MSLELQRATLTTAQIAALSAIAPLHPPRGMSWLDDSISGFDIYERGYVSTPRIFFDPTATTSANRGTYRNPYNDSTVLPYVMAGLQRGQKLGFKRGTTTRLGAGGLSLTCYGSSADPCMLIPYGDAEALPCLTTGVAIARASWTANGTYPAIYQLDLSDVLSSAGQVDAWDNSTGAWVRYFTRSSLANLNSAGPGYAYYAAGTLYIYPANSSSLDYIELADGNGDANDRGLVIDSTGGLIVAGLEVRNTRGLGMTLINSSTSASDFIQVVGCKLGQGGFDNASSPGGGGSLLSIYGKSKSNRLTNVYVAGNYFSETLNCAMECGDISGLVFEFNQSLHCSKAIGEFYAPTSDAVIRFNKGIGDYANRLKQTASAPSGSRGFWLSGLDDGGSADAPSHYLNNVMYSNILDQCDMPLQADSGTLNVYNNVFIGGYSADYGTVALYGNGAKVWTGETQNNFYYGRRQAAAIDVNAASVSTWATTSNNNYYSGEGLSGGGTYFALNVAGASYTDLATYKAAVSARDTNAKTGKHYTESIAAMPVMLNSDYTPVTVPPNSASSLVSGGIAVTGMTRDYYGKAWITNNIGACQV